MSVSNFERPERNSEHEQVENRRLRYFKVISIQISSTSNHQPAFFCVVFQCISCYSSTKAAVKHFTDQETPGKVWWLSRKWAVVVKFFATVWWRHIPEVEPAHESSDVSQLPISAFTYDLPPSLSSPSSLCPPVSHFLAALGRGPVFLERDHRAAGQTSLDSLPFTAGRTERWRLNGGWL